VALSEEIGTLATVALDVGLVLPDSLTWERYEEIAKGISRANRGLLW